MFTGLVQTVGSIRSLQPGLLGMLRIGIDPGPWKHHPNVGDSIAINGCCLTLANSSPPPPTRPVKSAPSSKLAKPIRTAPRLWSFNAVQETLSKSTLGKLKVGDRVNLEHAATASTLLGGHIVQGHVDGIGTVKQVLTGEDWRVRIAVPEPALSKKLASSRRTSSLPSQGFAQYLVPKGSVCVNGVSLTIADLWRKPGSTSKVPLGFEVALIPTTLEQTTLASLAVGDQVNLEADIIAKTIVHWLQTFGEHMRA